MHDRRRHAGGRSASLQPLLVAEEAAMFKALGALLVLYTVYSALRGEVYAKHRAWGRSILRDEEPRYFWLVIGIYGLLAAALIFVF